MTTFWIILAAVNLTVIFSLVMAVMLGNRRIPHLDSVSIDKVDRWPAVAIVVAARNEQRNIEPALLSLLRMDYDDYRVIVVDDRSTDGTGEILDEIADRHDRLTVYHLSELPAGWLGKNHALYFGVQRSTGEYLLFTDADVVMDPKTLRRAMAHVRRNAVDHLAISPNADMPSIVLQAFVILFINLFAIYTRPWKVSNPKSSAFIGIGAFNLVRRGAYDAAGTHGAIAMRPDDDVKLGKIIKANGFRQHVLLGTSMIRVPWYGSVGELVRGMEKNAFSGVDYRISVVVAGTIALLAFDVWPFVAAFALGGIVRYLYIVTVVVLLGHASLTAFEMKFSRWSAMLFPLAVLMFIYIQWRAMLLTYWNGGIRWRDTHYSLDELRANKV